MNDLIGKSKRWRRLAFEARDGLPRLMYLPPTPVRNAFPLRVRVRVPALPAFSIPRPKFPEAIASRTRFLRLLLTDPRQGFRLFVKHKMPHGPGQNETADNESKRISQAGE
ncbi:MAG: hypothetical protein WC670_12860 [Pseudolabrys sp.]